MAIEPISGIAGYTELRRDLLHLADEENKTRLLLIDIQKQKNEAILALVLAADKIFTRSLTERDPDGNVKKEFKTDTDVQAVADHVMPSRRSCGLCGKPGHRRDSCPDANKIEREKKELSKTKDERAAAKAALKGTGKRACSNCHKPGHRAKNCTEPIIPTRRKK